MCVSHHFEFVLVATQKYFFATNVMSGKRSVLYTVQTWTVRAGSCLSFKKLVSDSVDIDSRA